jgi:CubicO group peptidase (beta-lactamase class C family)
MSYTVIAAVVEAVTGEPFADAMRRLVVEPLKMTATVPNDPRRSPPRRTAFYETGEDDRPVRAPRYDPSHKLAGAG